MNVITPVYSMYVLLFSKISFIRCIHSSFDYMTPAAFEASRNPAGSATLRLPDCGINNVDNSLIEVGT